MIFTNNLQKQQNHNKMLFNRSHCIYILLLSLYFFTASDVLGQNTFQLLLKNPEDENLFNALESSDGYIFVGDRGHWSPEWRSLLIKTNKNGMVLQNNEYPLTDSLSLFTATLQIQANEFMMIECIAPDPVNGNFNSIRFNKVDSNFNRTCTKLFSLPYNYYISLCKAKCIHNEIVLFGYNYYIDQYSPRPFVLIFDMDGNLLKQNMFENHFAPATDLVLSPDERSFLLFAQGYTGSSSGDIIKLDTNLVIDTNYALPFGIDSRTSGEWINPNKLLLAGDCTTHNKAYNTSFSGNRDLVVATMDSLFNPEYHSYLGKADTFDAAGLYYCQDFITPNEIFFAGTANMGLSPYMDIHSWFILNNLDSNLNLHWQKYYGGDAYYNLCGLLATQDGGCLMYGTRYDAQTQYNERDLYILKVDENGLFTGIGESSGLMAHDAIIYPNPGCDFLNIQSGPQINGAMFTLYDMQGRVRIEESINNTQLKINTMQMPAGVYPWQIVFKNKVIENGKWLKE
jgi:hypothetical protein